MLGADGLYSTELTDEERDLGFEIVEVFVPEQSVFSQQCPLHAAAYRFTETDQIVKMNVPVIGGYSFRHERLATAGGLKATSRWMPVSSVVFPTAEQALNSVGSLRNQLQLCH